MKLVKFTEEFLELTWKWLNDKEIKLLTNTPDFSKDEQSWWFKSLEVKKDYLIWGILYNEVPIGACGLKNLTSKDCEYWGYIGDKNYWGKGVGSQILKSLIEIAKNKHFTSIWLQVIKNNPRAIHLYSKYGFEKESVENNNLIKMRLLL